MPLPGWWACRRGYSRDPPRGDPGRGCSRSHRCEVKAGLGEAGRVWARLVASGAQPAFFDIRGFHDAILGGGAMPLDLLEQRVDRWIASQKNA